MGVWQGKIWVSASRDSPGGGLTASARSANSGGLGAQPPAGSRGPVIDNN